MSRSRKKNWFGGNCSGSDKLDKRYANRKYRKYVNDHITDELLPELREISSNWTFTKDGKSRFEDEKWLRK